MARSAGPTPAAARARWQTSCTGASRKSTSSSFLEKTFRGYPGPLGERLELRPHDGGVNAPVEGPLGKAAIRARQDPVASDELRQAHDPLRHELRMLDDVGGLADHPRRELLAFGQLDGLPHAPFVLMAWVRTLDEIGPRLALEHQVDD